MGRTLAASSRQTIASASGHVAIYTRISRDSEGRSLGVERQKQDCIDLAKRLGYASWTIFEDNDVSASTLSKKLRPQFQQMIERTTRGEFAAIIAYSNSRLTRRVVELQALINLTQETGIRIHTVASGQHDLDTADGRAAMLTIAVWDQAEAERAAERVKRASRQRVEDGRWHGGVPPFGYDKHEKALRVSDKEATVIQDAIHRVLDFDESLYSIVKDWNKRNIPTRKRSTWRTSTLHKILTSKSLLGVNSAGVEAWEPIIDRATHDRLLDKLATDPARRTNPDGVKSAKYSLTGGLTVCGRCGGSLGAIKREGVPTKLVCRAFQNPDPKGKFHALRDDGTSEGRVVVDLAQLEEFVMQACIDLLNDDDYWAEQKRKRAGADSDIAKLRNLRTERMAERDRAGRAFIAGIMSERDAQAEVARVSREIEDIGRQIDNASGGPTAHDVWGHRKDILARWRTWNSGQLRVFFRLMITRVTVGDWPEIEDKSGNRKRMATAALPRKGESSKDFEARRNALVREAMKARVKIDWRE